MALEPIYPADNVKAAYQLRYNWTAWPSGPPFPPRPNEAFFTTIFAAWEGDGIRVLDVNWRPHQITILTSVKPWVSPVLFTRRMKGRLNLALRKHNTPTKFSRKVAMYTVGDARRQRVEAYVARQVAKEPLADPRFKAFLEQFTVTCNEVDLSQPVPTASGRYWYNLHVVLVVQNRVRISDGIWLGKLRDTSLRIAEVKQHRLSAVSVMPDHLHLALGGNISQSPSEIALSYMNNLAHALRQDALWQASYYAGSFGEYDMDAIRYGRGGK